MSKWTFEVPWIMHQRLSPCMVCTEERHQKSTVFISPLKKEENIFTWQQQNVAPSLYTTFLCLRPRQYGKSTWSWRWSWYFDHRLLLRLGRIELVRLVSNQAKVALLGLSTRLLETRRRRDSAACGLQTTRRSRARRLWSLSCAPSPRWRRAPRWWRSTSRTSTLSTFTEQSERVLSTVGASSDQLSARCVPSHHWQHG